MPGRRVVKHHEWQMIAGRRTGEGVGIVAGHFLRDEALRPVVGLATRNMAERQARFAVFTHQHRIQEGGVGHRHILGARVLVGRPFAYHRRARVHHEMAGDREHSIRQLDIEGGLALRQLPGGPRVQLPAALRARVRLPVHRGAEFR